MKNHTLQFRVDDATARRLTNYCLRMRREKSDALRILLTDALDAEDRKLVDPPGEYRVEMAP